jgi:hypothetical protein
MKKLGIVATVRLAFSASATIQLVPWKKILPAKWALIPLLLMPGLAAAVTINQAVAKSAMTHMSENIEVNGVPADAVYVGQFDGCDSVAIVRRGGKFIDNYRVCNGEIKSRGTVSPSWDENASRAVLLSVVNNAIYHGEAQQMDEAGYLIAARPLGTISSKCKNIEVIVSYDGDFVDRGMKEICR